MTKFGKIYFGMEKRTFDKQKILVYDSKNLQLYAILQKDPPP